VKTNLAHIYLQIKL